MDQELLCVKHKFKNQTLMTQHSKADFHEVKNFLPQSYLDPSYYKKEKREKNENLANKP